jgi:hypothetical protein
MRGVYNREMTKREVAATEIVTDEATINEMFFIIEIQLRVCAQLFEMFLVCLLVRLFFMRESFLHISFVSFQAVAIVHLSLLGDSCLCTICCSFSYICCPYRQLYLLPFSGSYICFEGFLFMVNTKC